VIVTSINVKH